MAGLFARRTRHPAEALAPAAALPTAPRIPDQAEPVSAEPAFSSVAAVLSAEAAAAADVQPPPAGTGFVRSLGTALRELLRGLATAFIATHLSLLFWSMAPLVMGWTPTVIISGSMEPAVHVGDVVYYAPADVATITDGRMILVKLDDGRLLSHRLHSRNEDGTLSTKGDANPDVDGTAVRPEQVRGVARLIVPHIGKVALWGPEHRRQAILWALLTVLALVLARGPHPVCRN
jgi:signal peptidase I